jgi:hypothetical protein
MKAVRVALVLLLSLSCLSRYAETRPLRIAEAAAAVIIQIFLIGSPSH